MNLLRFALGTFALCACEGRGDPGRDASSPNTDGSVIDGVADVSSERAADGGDALAFDVDPGDVKPPLDDAGFPEHWGERCGTVPALRPFYRYHMSTRTVSGAAPACGALPAGGPARWMALRIDAGESVLLKVASDGGPAASLRAFDACGGACVAMRTARDVDGALLAWWRNPDASARVLHVAVGAAEPGARGRFWFWTRVGPTGANATCATAARAASFMSTMVTSVGDEPASCGPRQVPSSWFAANVPPGARLSVRSVTSGAITDIAAAELHLLDACGGTCVRPATTSFGWVNEGTSAIDARVAVSALDPLDERGVVVVSQVEPAPANARCDGAIELPESVRATEVWSLSAAPACVAAPWARALFYRARVGAGETIHVSGATGAAQPRFAVLDACGGQCLGATTSDAARADARWTNTGTGAREVWVAATGVPREGVWEHSIESTVGAPAPRMTCATALRVSDGMALAGERPLLATGTAPCGASGETGAYYYAARVGAGETLTLMGRGRFRVLDGCEGARCLDLGGATVSDNSLAWRNDGATARDVVVAMSLPRERQHDAVDLRVAIGRPRYAMTRITAECEPTTGALDARYTSTFLGSTGTVWQALPFELPYFGATMRSWRLASPGGIRLDGSAPTDMAAYEARLRSSVTTLPISGEGPLLAPLIDPAFSLDFAGEIRWLDVAAPRRHVTFDVRPNAMARAPYLHHQVRLYADGAVEFHYCDVVGGASYDASRAVVGMQGGTPVSAMTWSAFVRDAVQPGMGVRFTPQ